jgi:uncharacterized protein
MEWILNLGETEVFQRFPQAKLTRDNVAHFYGLLRNKLIVNRCQDCGYWIYPLRPMCPECWSVAVEPTEVSGRGSIYMFTVLNQGPPTAGFEYPQVQVAVELEEQAGLRYLGPLVDCPKSELAHGLLVEVVWRETDGKPVAVFQPRVEVGAQS